MVSESKSIIDFELKVRFYFLELPPNVNPYCWRQRDGNFCLMDQMDITHLKSCIETIIKSITSLVKERGESEVVKKLKPLAEDKLTELQEVYKKKTNNL